MDIGHFLSKNNFFILLSLLLLYFVATAVITNTHYEFLVSVFSILLMVACLYVIGHSARMLVISALLLAVLLIIIFASSNFFVIPFYLLLLQSMLAVIFFFLIMIMSLTYTLRGEKVTLNNLCGAICTYLLLGLAWGYVFLFVDVLDPSGLQSALSTTIEHDNFPELVYYSFVTLTTLGFGDIFPVSDLARLFSWLEAVTGQIYLTILIAQLVAKYVAHHRGG